MAVDINLLRSLISLQDLAESGTENLGSSVRDQAGAYTSPYQQQLAAKQGELNNWEAVQENKTPTDVYSNSNPNYAAYRGNLENYVNYLTGAADSTSYYGPANYQETRRFGGGISDADVYAPGYYPQSGTTYAATHVVGNQFPDVAQAIELGRRSSTTADPGFVARPNYFATGTVTTDAAPDVPMLEGSFAASAPSQVGKALDKGIRSQQENLRAIALGKGDMSDLKYAKSNIGTARDIKDEVLAYGNGYANTVTGEVNAYKNRAQSYRAQVAALGNKQFTETTSEAADSPARNYDRNLESSRSYLNDATSTMHLPISYVTNLSGEPGNYDNPNSGGGAYDNAAVIAGRLRTADALNPVGTPRVEKFNPYQTLKNNLGQPGNFITLPTMPTFSVSEAPAYTSQVDTRWLEKQRRKKKVEALTRS